MPALPDPIFPTSDLTPPLPGTAGAEHLVIPWAVSLAEPQEEAGAGLDMTDALPELPTLQHLLEHLTEQQWLRGDEYQLAAPHERFLASAVGWGGAEETCEGGFSEAQPTQACWAALWACQDGLPASPGEAWGLMTPSHWLMGRDHLTLLHPDELALSETESRTLFDAVRPLFESEGWELIWGAPLRWYVRHPSLAGLPSASLDRVIGRNPDLWMPNHPQARLLRRLQNEVQMLLYQHPVNDEREARRALAQRHGHPFGRHQLATMAAARGQCPPPSPAARRSARLASSMAGTGHRPAARTARRTGRRPAGSPDLVRRATRPHLVPAGPAPGPVGQRAPRPAVGQAGHLRRRPAAPTLNSIRSP